MENCKTIPLSAKKIMEGIYINLVIQAISPKRSFVLKKTFKNNCPKPYLVIYSLL